MIRLIAAAVSILLAVPAYACGVEQVSIQNFSSEIDQWSDGSGNVVRLTGDVVSACTTTAKVELLIAAKASGGGTLRQVSSWLTVRPGGIPFDLAGTIPYDPNAASYEVSIARVK